MSTEAEAEDLRIDSRDVKRVAKQHAQQHHGSIQTIVKARLIGADIPISNQVTREEEETAFTNAGALEPPYDPEMLCLLFEHSNSLRQNVDAYTTNIDGFGHTLVPVIDLDAGDANERIARAFDMLGQAGAFDESKIKFKRDEMKALMAGERTRADLFFEFCSPEISFVTLRRRTRQNLEVMGNAYWEVLRNNKGEITEFVYVPGFMIRLLPIDKEQTKFHTHIKTSELHFEKVPKKKRFRRYVQIVETRVVYFKEFGDPRCVSSETGIAYRDQDHMRRHEEHAAPATELKHFKIHSPRTPYGIPRWIGNLLSVLGSRQAEEVNFLYFENKSIPPMAIIVSGGKLSNEAVKRLEDHIKTNIIGKRNFHKLLILEGEPAQGASPEAASKMRIQIVPLMGAQHTDALFQDYDASNNDKVGQAFRLPRMLRGDVRDFNRSTAEAALTFAEMQVFQPEREEFDFIFNREIFPALGIRTWKFKSLAPIARDPSTMAEMIKNLVNANVLTPEEARVLAGDVFNREFKILKAWWTKQPVPLSLAGFPVSTGQSSDEDELPEQTPPANPPTKPQDAAVPPKGGRGADSAKRARATLLDEAVRLVAMRKAFDYAETQLARSQLDEMRKEGAEEVVRIPDVEFRALVGA